ncbi:hypothetical protein DFH06DRAFT_1056582 [Mycena polygramma]|nr:hypothetical protein DFH06DRAFT_1056582 [Mycena polygramma]
MASPKTNETPVDAPPAYDGASASSSTRTEKARAPPPPVSPSSSSVPRAQPRRAAQESTSWTALGGSLLAEVGLGSAQHRVAQEVRKTVTGLIHDLVWEQTADQERVTILDSCAHVCASHSVHFPSLLQEQYIEGHTPLYWAVVKRSVDEANPPTSYELPPLIRALVAYSAPLTKSTIEDIRLACLHSGDQWLYQSLRLCPDFQALPHKSQLLLSVQVPPDTITVGPAARHDAPFTADFEFAEFQKRMRVVREVKIEFISHARMWEISFFITAGVDQVTSREGQWGARLRLWDQNSPSTSVIATFVLVPQESAAESVSLEVEGKLDGSGEHGLHGALPDAIQYPRSPFLTAEGILRGRLTIQIKDK